MGDTLHDCPTEDDSILRNRQYGVVEDGGAPVRLASYLEELERRKDFLSAFSLSYTPRDGKVKADLLARTGRRYLLDVLFVDTKLSV